MEKLVLTFNVSPQKYKDKHKFMQEKEADYVPAGIQKSIEKTASTIRSSSFDIPPESRSEEPNSGETKEIYTILIQEAPKSRNYGLSMRFFGALKSFFQHSGNR